MSTRMIACFAALALVSTLTAQEPPAVRPRTIRTQQVMSEALGGVRTFGLLLPPDYERSARRYPVLYLLHGSGQRHSTWGRRTLVDNTTGAIVVMPDMDRARYVVGEGRVDAYAEAFITTELVDHIDRNYRTLAARDGRAIAGLSIGGFGAMLLGLRNIDRFGAIGAFSAPLDGIGDPAELAIARRDPAYPPTGLATGVPRPLLFLGCGIADSL